MNEEVRCAYCKPATDQSAASRNYARRISGSFIGCLTADELGLAFGRQVVIHGALCAGGLTSRVVEEAQRLKAIREVATAGPSERKRQLNER